MKKIVVVVILSFFMSVFSNALTIDETLQSMTLRQKIGQLFMPGAFAFPDELDAPMIETLICDYNIGGLIFMRGELEKQRELAARYQSIAKIPLLIAQDAEWGVSMRLPGATKFPRNMTLGAIVDNALLYEFGKEIGRQCKTVGVNVNFAPVVDVNNNSKNPVINDRSFGEDPAVVAQKGISVMNGLQSEGVLACAKHFPGHGNTEVDSHRGLPVQGQTYDDLEKIELVPFKALADAGVDAFMTAHINFPALDATPDLPITLSSILTGLAREKLRFNGLLFTDSLKMKAIADQFSMVEAALLAFKAGSDVIIFCKPLPATEEMKRDISTSIDALEKEVKEGNVQETDIDERVVRILKAKEQIAQAVTKGHDNSLENLTDTRGKKLKQKLYTEAVTLVKNNGGILPLGNYDAPPTVFVQVGGDYSKILQHDLKSHYQRFFSMESVLALNDVEPFVKELAEFDLVIVGLYDMNKFEENNWGIWYSTEYFLERLRQEGKTVILCVFGSPYSLKLFGYENVIVLGYEDDRDAERAVAGVIKGTLHPRGKLPVTASDQFSAGLGLIL